VKIPLSPSSIQSWYSVIGAPPLSREFSSCRVIVVRVAATNFGAAGELGGDAASRNPIGEY
jgi:hypothetical protein